MNPQEHRKKDEDEESEEILPFQGLDKGIVLQERRVFNETPLSSRKCCHLLTKLLYLVTQGETFTKAEATDVFFAVTKLFQSRDIVLRRMVYLVLKELAPMAEDVIIVSASLTKDMNSSIDLYRANAIRVLCRVITDMSILGQGERYLKQAIVDKESYVSSAALVSGLKMLQNPANGDLVKRWWNEIHEASRNTKAPMVQYHALGLMYLLKQNDRLAVTKLVRDKTSGSIRSPFAHCLLIRYTSQVLAEEDPESPTYRSLYDYLESCLRSKSEMVQFEAARNICGLPRVTSHELTPAIAVLQNFLNLVKPTLRFAAVRCLNKVAMTHPLSVTNCNAAMEALITDTNRSIATLAITTLLKTGSESSIDRLMKQIANFMGEIPDEFKVVVVEAIRALCLKFPSKHRGLMNFLSNILRDEGGFEYKKAIVETILTIIEEIPSAKETGLTHLCEFIEDCEFTYLSTRILHLLGQEGPQTTCPHKYIRYIYNRIILENATVRASAVSALVKFGLKIASLRENIINLLSRCMSDNDDEVRDRATFFLKLLKADANLAQSYVVADCPFPLANLESKLIEYKNGPKDQPFDIRSVPKTVTLQENIKQQKAARKQGGAIGQKQKQEEAYLEALAALPATANCGTLFKSCKPVELTESETEYVVNCVKHIFPEHIVLQFNVTNTLEDQVLDNAIVKVEPETDEFEVEEEVTAPRLIFQVPGASYCFMKVDGYPTGACTNTLKFMMKEVDPATGDVDEEGEEDDYQLEDIEISTCDYVQRSPVSNFQAKWDELGEECEVVETFNLSTMKTLKEAVSEIVEFLGMQPCNKSEMVPENSNKQILYLSGTFVGGVPVLARARMLLDPAGGVNLELTVRSTDEEISVAIASAL